MESEGRKLHGQAAKARENGDHLKALQLEDEAMLAYQKDGDILGFAEIIADRSIVLRHLADETGDKNFLLVAKGEMEASVEIARNSGKQDALSIPLYNLAKVEEELDQYTESINHYQEAISTQTNPIVIADMKVHLATCEYKNGDKSALYKAEQALSELQASNEEKYDKDVWTSSAHMRIADMLREDNPEKAKEHLQKAKKIIDANPELKLRAEQWKKLVDSF